MNKKSVPKLHSIKWKTGANADNVELHPNRASKDIPVVDVLSGALNAQLKEVLVAGREPDGTLYVASSISDISRAHLLVSLAGKILLEYD